jgi:hypothetical protein
LNFVLVVVLVLRFQATAKTEDEYEDRCAEYEYET